MVKPKSQRCWWRIGFIGALLFSTHAVAPIVFAQEAGSEAAPPSTHGLNVQYAELSLQLAMVELRIAEEFNKEIAERVSALVTPIEGQKAEILAAKQYSQVTLERLTSNVDVAIEKLRQAKSASTGGTDRVILRYAKEKLRLAKVRLDETMASKRDSGQRKLEIERVRLKYDLAKLRVVMLMNPDHLLSTIEQLYLKTDQLSREIVVLEQRIEALEDQGHQHK